MTFPTDARWALAKPLPVQAFPAYRLLWRPETCLAELAAVMVCLATSIDCLENLCSLIAYPRSAGSSFATAPWAAVFLHIKQFPALAAFDYGKFIGTSDAPGALDLTLTAFYAIYV